MAARPGEENVATLFGDIHYFYGPETEYPPHHRFNKGSYVYLFENAQTGRARLEVANMPGTEHQDAFDGFLDYTNIRYSYKHSCMVSLTVLDVPNQEEWHLPTYDPTNQNIYHYKLRSLDLYFWTPRDALQFVNGVRRVLPAAQLDIQDEPVSVPPPPPQQHQQHQQQQQQQQQNQLQRGGSMSQVVQKLESVALADNGAPSFAGPPGAANAAAAATATPPQTQAVSAAPAASSSPAGTAPAVATPPTATSTASSTGFVPMAYNPAAPAAPETIRPREKTPPPEDAAANDPLHQRLAQDATTPFSPGLVIPQGLGPLSPGVPPPTMHSPPGAPSFAGPPTWQPQPQVQTQAQIHAQLQTTQPSPSPGLTRATTMPVATAFSGPPQQPPVTTSFSGPPQQTPVTTSFSGPPQQQQPPVTTSFAGPPSQATSIPVTSAALPVGAAGFSQYNYTTAGGPTTTTTATANGSGDFSVHQQLYRPTEGEAAVAYKPKQEVRGKFEENAGRLERGVTGMFKKFEKKFG